MKECGIYTIEINNKLYVGSSKDLKGRFKMHKHQLLNGTHSNIYLRRSYEKHKTYKFEILEYCEEEYLHSMEQYWMNMLNTTNNKFGYNLCSVAGTTRGIKYGEETKKKMSDSKKGRKYSDEHRKNMCIAFKGRIISNETREKISKTLTGRKIPRDIVEKRNRKRLKKVYQYTKEGIFIKEFLGVKNVSEELNINKRTIAGCARGEYKLAGGFIFKYNLICQ